MSATQPASAPVERDLRGDIERYLHRGLLGVPEPNRSMVAHLQARDIMDVIENGLRELPAAEIPFYYPEGAPSNP